MKLNALPVLALWLASASALAQSAPLLPPWVNRARVGAVSFSASKVVSK